MVFCHPDLHTVDAGSVADCEGYFLFIVFLGKAAVEMDRDDTFKGVFL
jgi:hypothetical protein